MNEDVAPSAPDAMRIVATLLVDTPFRSLPQAKAIDFDLLGERFTLDPRSAALVAPGSSSQAALVVRCAPAVLVRLFTDPHFALGRGEELSFAGDPAALSPVIAALSGGHSPLALRLAGTGERPAKPAKPPTAPRGR